MTTRPDLLTDTRPPPTVPCVKDLDGPGLVFWGVVSGTWTLEEGRSIGSGKGENTANSLKRSRLRDVLHHLTGVGALDGRTPFVPFDADRRCLRCGTVHDDHPLLRRSGVSCFRDLWGTVPLNPAGLRSGGRRG